MLSVLQEIEELKQKHNAVILAHFYEESDIQDIADHVGDSLYLAQMGEKCDNPVILLAGVVFMAESVKILSPKKTVIVPDLEAGCSLVDHSPYEKYLEWRCQRPEALAVTYVNSSAKVKSITDVVCTSTNAEKVIAAIPPERKILFGPDRNLGNYLSKKLEREFEIWPGACEVHVLFSARKLFELKQEHPDAIVLAHPECIEEVLEYADVIGSTSRLLKEVQDRPNNKFIVATEVGILHQMNKHSPQAELIQAPAEGSCACNECPYMKLNTLEKIRDALKSLEPQVTVEPEILELARVPMKRMMDITEGKSVTWPEKFV